MKRLAAVLIFCQSLPASSLLLLSTSPALPLAAPAHPLTDLTTTTNPFRSFTGTPVALGARAYLRLGSRDDEAEATATLGLAEAKNCLTIVECHRVLGHVAVRRGDAAAAEASFKEGVEYAQGCGMYLVALLAARDLAQHVLKEQGRELSLIHI